MIACNACQLLATNLPLCHRCLREASRARFGWLVWDLKRSRADSSYRRGQRVVASLIMTPLWRCLRWRLYCILQYNRGLDLFLLCWFFSRFYLQDGFENRLNLVWWGSIMGHLELILKLCWPTYFKKYVSYFFVDLLQFLLLKLFLASKGRDWTRLSGSISRDWTWPWAITTQDCVVNYNTIGTCSKEQVPITS